MEKRDIPTFERVRKHTYTLPSLPSSPWKDPLLPTLTLFFAKLTYADHRDAAKALSSPTIICFILYNWLPKLAGQYRDSDASTSRQRLGPSGALLVTRRMRGRFQDTLRLIREMASFSWRLLLRLGFRETWDGSFKFRMSQGCDGTWPSTSGAKSLSLFLRHYKRDQPKDAPASRIGEFSKLGQLLKLAAHVDKLKHIAQLALASPC